MKKELLIPRETIRSRVQELALRITSDYEGKEPVLIGILKGAIFFLSDLAREIRVPTRIDFIRAKSYGSQMDSCGRVEVLKDVELSLEGKAVILVEDIVDTGLTLSHIVREIKQKGPESVKTCALIDKTQRREVPLSVDYVGFRVEEGFVVGYGLDFDEDYRYMPDICVLREQEDP